MFSMRTKVFLQHKHIKKGNFRYKEEEEKEEKKESCTF
jgi:hypothetical protein